MFRALVLPLALLLSLAGCTPALQEAPTESPSPVVTEPAPAVTEAEVPAAPALSIPNSCIDLVPLATVRAQFSPGFESIGMVPGWGDPEAGDFVNRGGITCLWGIPNSGAAALTVYVAPRATSTDEEQITAWSAAGYSECPTFLDGCFYEALSFDGVDVRIIHALVGGFEMRVEAGSAPLDPLLVAARAAATSMGYV